MPEYPVTKAEFPHLDHAVDFLTEKAKEPGFEVIAECLRMMEDYLRVERLDEIERTAWLFEPGGPLGGDGGRTD